MNERLCKFCPNKATEFVGLTGIKTKRGYCHDCYERMVRNFNLLREDSQTRDAIKVINREVLLEQE